MNIKSLKQECFEANLQLPKLGLVLFTFGNVSILDKEKSLFAIKPSGLSYEKMRWQDIVIVDLDNNVIDGDKRPSSDTKTHSVLYKKWDNIGSVVHTHSTFAVAWAQSKRDVPIYGTTHADHLAFDIPCTEPMEDSKIAGDYETETGFQITNCFEKRGISASEVSMVLVANHGPFTWGKDGEYSVYNAKVLEELCQMALYTEQISTNPERMKASLIQKHYERKHGKNAYYGQK